MTSRFAALIFILITILLASSGCGTARIWGAKGPSSPASVGADLSIPLGK